MDRESFASKINIRCCMHRWLQKGIFHTWFCMTLIYVYTKPMAEHHVCITLCALDSSLKLCHLNMWVICVKEPQRLCSFAMGTSLRMWNHDIILWLHDHCPFHSLKCMLVKTSIAVKPVATSQVGERWPDYVGR